MSVLDKVNQFVGMQQSPETQRAYARDIRVYLDFMEELGVEPEWVKESDALAFRDFLVERYTPNGAARVWNTVRTLHKYARVSDNPFEWVKPPKRNTNVTPRVPEDGAVEALVGAAQDNPQRALIIALLLNGLRASEVAGLTKDRVEYHDLPDDRVMVLRVIGKGQKERMVPATAEVASAMVVYWRECSDRQRESPFVVSDYDGTPLTYRQVEHAVYKSAEYAGIEGMHPHALRHHYATRLIRNGVETPYVQRLLGHSSLATTQTYLGLDLGDLVIASRRDPRNFTSA